MQDKILAVKYFNTANIEEVAVLSPSTIDLQ